MNVVYAVADREAHCSEKARLFTEVICHAGHPFKYLTILIPTSVCAVI